MGRKFQRLAVRGNKTVDIGIRVTFRDGDRKMMQYIRVTSRQPREKGSGTSWASSKEHLPKKRRKLTTFRWWAKGSWEIASEGATVLHICNCGFHVPEERGDEKRKGGELIHLSALCFVIVIFYVFGSKINLN